MSSIVKYEAPNGIVYSFEIDGDVPTPEEERDIEQEFTRREYQNRTTAEEFLTPDALAEPAATLATPTTTVVGSGPMGADGRPGVTVTVDALNNSFLSREERQQVLDQTRERYEQDPTYNDSIFGSSVRGADNVPYRIPSMTVGFDGDIDINNSVIQEGVRDGAKHIAVLGGDAVDAARSLVGAESKDYGQKIQEGMSEFKEERLFQSLGKEASGMIGPGGVGAGIAKIGASILKLGPKLKALVTGTGIAVGTTAGTDADDVSTVFTGDNALLPSDLVEGYLGVDPSDPKWKQRMQVRTNILLEEGTLGTLLEGTVKTAGVLTKLAGEMSLGTLFTTLGMGQRSRQQMLAVKEINERLSAVETSSGEQREAFLRNLADSIEKHAQTVIDIDDPLVDLITLDNSTMNAFYQAVESGDMVALERTINKARQIQQGAISKGGATEVAAGSARTATEGTMDTTVDRLGGDAAVDEATTVLQNQALGEIDEADRVVVGLEGEIAQADAALNAAIDEDPLVGESLASLSQKTGVEFTAQGSTGRLRNIADRVIESYRVLKGQRNEVYETVEGGDLDTEALFEFLRGTKPAQLDAARNSVGRTNQLATIFDIIDPSRTKQIDVTDAKGKVSTETAPMSDEELLEEFNAALEEAGIVDYGTMFSKLRGPMASLKSELFDNADTAARGAGRELDQLIKFIDGKLLDGTGDDELIEAVAMAKAWDQENFIPYFRDTPQLAEIARVFDERIASSSTPTGVRSGADFNSVRQTSVNQIKEGLSEDAALYGERVIQLLRTEAGGGDADDVVGFFINEAMRPLQSSIKFNGTPSEEAVVQAVSSLQQYASLIVDEFPDAAKRIKVLEDNLLAGGNKSRMLGKSLDEAREAAERVKEKVFNVKLNEFFGDNGLPVKNAQAAWTKLLNNFDSAQDVGRFTNLMDAVFEAGDPIVIQGMQAAVLKRVRESFITSAKTVSGTPGMSLSGIAKDSVTGTGSKRLLEALQIAFKDRPVVAEGLIDLLARSGNEQALATRSGIIAGSDTAVKKEQLQSFNSLVTVILGPLSRTGARVRAVGTKLINRAGGEEAYQDAVDFVLANPEEYARLTRKIMDQEFGAKTGIRGFINASIDPVLSSLVKAGMVDPNDAQEIQQSPDRIYQALEMEAMATEEVQKIRDSAGSIWRDMQDWLMTR